MDNDDLLFLRFFFFFSVSFILTSCGVSSLQIKNVTLEILNVVRETKNDDLTNTLQKIISVYQEELADLAVDMCQHLVRILLE